MLYYDEIVLFIFFFINTVQKSYIIITNNTIHGKNKRDTFSITRFPHIYYYRELMIQCNYNFMNL